jgi:putative transposase
LQAVLRPVGVKGFGVLPKRWSVERTFAWINKYRRNAKDYERNTESSKAMIYIAMADRMLKMLEKSDVPG